MGGEGQGEGVRRLDQLSADVDELRERFILRRDPLTPALSPLRGARGNK
jgi:hypothetical protein